MLHQAATIYWYRAKISTCRTFKKIVIRQVASMSKSKSIDCSNIIPYCYCSIHSYHKQFCYGGREPDGKEALSTVNQTQRVRCVFSVMRLLMNFYSVPKVNVVY